MPFLRIPLAGSKGVNRDLSVHELQEGVWTSANNVRFLDGYAQQFYDFQEIYPGGGAIPYFLLPLAIGEQRHWIYAGATKVYGVYVDTILGVTHTDLSGATYTATPNSWTGTLLGGIPILNNGTDAPLQWDTDLTHNFASLSNWPASTTCKSLRGYKQFLVALGVTKGTTEYPYMVKWSHPAEPGAIPASWDHTDPTYDAGEADIAEGYDVIVDGLQLRDSFMIYKESSVWRMDLIGGVSIFRFSKVLGTSGAMNRNCIVELDGVHFVLTSSDVIVHDGQTPTSVLDKVTRRELFREMDISTRSNAFVFKNHYFNEVYVCYPAVGNTSCNRAMVWNYRDKTVSFQDLPGVFHGSYGPVEYEPSDSWDSDGDPWDADLTYWNAASPVPSRVRVLLAGADQKFYLSDSAAVTGNSPPASYIERVGMAFGVPDQDGRVPMNGENRICIRGVRPRISGSSGSVTIKVGGSDISPFEAPVYDATMTHQINSTLRNDCLVDRRYIAIRIENLDAYQWRLDSLDIEYEVSGEW